MGNIGAQCDDPSSQIVIDDVWYFVFHCFFVFKKSMLETQSVLGIYIDFFRVC